MTRCAHDVVRAAEAVRFEAGQVRWMGEPVPGVELQRTLAATLYRCWYPFDRCRSLADAEEPSRTAASSRLVHRLVAAAAPYASVAVRVGQSPGWVSFFSLARGGDGASRTMPDPDVRLYWNVSASGAGALAAGLAEAFDRLALPFHFKVRFGDAPWSPRADVAVLYLDRETLVAAEGDLVRIHRLLRPRLRWARPALTDRLSHGLSLARQPSGLRSSFGLQRCDLVARAIVDAHLRGEPPRAWVQAVAESFHAAGVCWDEPWRERRQPALALPAVRRTATEPLAPAAPDWLGSSQRVGHEIASAALWHGTRCTWLDVDLEEAAAHRWRPLSARLFDGGAGVGWALAGLAADGGDDRLARTARACLTTALGAAPRTPGPGLLTGAPGVALGVAVGGRLLRDEGLLAGGRALALAAARSAIGSAIGSAISSAPAGGRDDSAGGLDTGGLDLADGLAGALLALTWTAATIAGEGQGADPELRLAIAHVTRQLGRAVDRLLEAPGGTWRIPAGVAHGAAGIAWALAEAGAATGEAAAAAWALRLCDAERRWLDPEAGNWADTRSVPQDRLADMRPPGARYDRFYWCHGAPGIAVTRRRIATLTGDEGAASDATLGLRSTVRAAEAFPTAGSDTSLCHGAAGLASMLSWLVAEYHGTGEVEAGLLDRGRAAASGLAAAALDACEGVPPWTVPWGLLTGAAGIALAALRVGGLAAPSPILPLAAGAAPLAYPVHAPPAHHHPLHEPPAHRDGTTGNERESHAR